jgi:hypothetical protein
VTASAAFSRRYCSLLLVDACAPGEPGNPTGGTSLSRDAVFDRRRTGGMSNARTNVSRLCVCLVRCCRSNVTVISTSTLAAIRLRSWSWSSKSRTNSVCFLRSFAQCAAAALRYQFVLHDYPRCIGEANLALEESDVAQTDVMQQGLFQENYNRNFRVLNGIDYTHVHRSSNN